MKVCGLKPFCIFTALVFSVWTHPKAQVSAGVYYREFAEKFAPLISLENIKNHVYTLASDEFEGRETGTPGIQKAADYIISKLQTYDIQPLADIGYTQEVAFTWLSWKNTSITVNEERFKHLWDFIAFPQFNAHLGDFTTNEVLFLGYGIDDHTYSDYKNVEVKNKVLLIYKGVPTDKQGKPRQHLEKWDRNIELKMKTAADHGAKMILIIEDDIKKVLNDHRRELLGPKVLLGKPQDQASSPINCLLISTNLARAILGEHFKKFVKTRDVINRKGKPRNLVLNTNLYVKLDKKIEQLNGHNILAYIEGSDPNLKDQVVILTAHYDHLGMRGDNIFNGADDNGTGSATILELARLFQEAKRLGAGLKRSILCMWVCGEEKGLLGSKYYVENPIFPLENSIANINVDMIGRRDSNYIHDPNYVYVIGADKMSSDLHQINEEANRLFVGLQLDYRYNDENDPNRFYYRSDHYNFVEKGIPAVFYFTGVHNDYHRPSDTADKIEYEKIIPIAQLIFHVAWELANRDERIKIDVIQK